MKDLTPSPRDEQMKDLTPESHSSSTHCAKASCSATVDVVGVHEKTGAEAPAFTFKPVSGTD